MMDKMPGAKHGACVFGCTAGEHLVRITSKINRDSGMWVTVEEAYARQVEVPMDRAVEEGGTIRHVVHGATMEWKADRAYDAGEPCSVKAHLPVRLEPTTILVDTNGDYVATVASQDGNTGWVRITGACIDDVPEMVPLCPRQRGDSLHMARCRRLEAQQAEMPDGSAWSG